MSSSSPSGAVFPCLDPNPDISGIGVRISIYVQAFLNIACAITFSRDTWISDFEHTILTTASLNLFLIGCALLVCTIVQGSTFGITVHHALIVLNLNWIVGLSALLYVFIWTYNVVATLLAIPGCGAPEYEVPDDDIPEGKWMIGLSAVHLCGTGAVGVWVWTKIRSFGDQPECTPLTVMTVFGRNISVLNGSLKKVSLAVYWMAAIPFVNLLCVFLAALIVMGLLGLVYLGIRRFRALQDLSWRTFVLFGGISAIILLDVLFIVDTELMISRPRMHSELVKLGEGQWTFGQTLALVGLIVPVTDTGKILWKAIKSDRKKVHPWNRSALGLTQTIPWDD